MSNLIDKIVVDRQKNGFRRGGEIHYDGQNWEDHCSQIYIDDITLDRPTQTITVFAVDDGDDNPDFRYRVNQGTWTDTPDFVGLSPGHYDVFVENQNTGCVVNAAVQVIACDLTIDQFLYDDEYYDLTNGWIELTVSTTSENPVEVRFNGGSWIEKEGRTFRWEGLNEGDYTIEVRDEWGCAVSKSITLINIADTEEPTAPDKLETQDVQEGEALRIDWEKSVDSQTWVVYYRIHRSTTQGFTPDASTIIKDTYNGGVNTTGNDSEWEEPFWVDENVTHGQTYYYRITAFDARGNESAPSDELAITFTDDVQPNPPTSLGTLSGNTEAELYWNLSSTGDVQKYRIYRSLDGQSWMQIAEQQVLTYLDTGLTNGTQYHYRVTAIDEAGNESVPTQPESVIPADVTPPAVPSINASVTEDVKQVDLSITMDDTSDLQGYRIYRAYEKSDGTLTAYKRVHQIDATQGTASWVDTNVEWDRKYYYKVTSIDEVPNESPQSARTPATPFPDRTPPALPSITGKQKFFGEPEVELTVTIQDTTDLQGYNIYRATSSGGPYTLVKQISSTKASETWLDTTTQLSTEYFYVATSFDEGPNIPGADPNESAYSTEISVLPEPVPQDQSVEVNLPANTVGADPGFLGYDLSTLADTIFWDYVLESGDDIRIRRPDGDNLPMVLLEFDKQNSSGYVLFSDPEFDPTSDHKYFIWFDDPDNAGREGTPAGRQAFADDVYQKIPNLQFLMLNGETQNRVSAQSGVTIHYVHDHLPEGWQKATFSGTQNKGAVTHNGGQSYTFEAYGDDIWNNTSHGEYLFKPIVGDCKITTKVILQDDTDQWAKFGPYITSDVYERAPMAALLLTPNDGLFGDVRKSRNGNNTHAAEDRNIDLSPQSTSEDPVWLHMERTGGEIIYRYSTDGSTWTELGRAQDFLPKRIAAGLAATSHNQSTACTVETREVSVEGAEGNFMHGDDQILALDGIHFDPANSDTIENMHTTLLIEPRMVVDNAGEGMVLSFDRNEYFRLSAPDGYANRIGFDSQHNGSQYDSDQMDQGYDFDQQVEALIQWMFEKEGSSDYRKEKWMNGAREDYKNTSDPMIGSNKRYGLIGANSESAAFMDENWSEKGPHHIFKFFLWALTARTGAERQAEEDFLWRAKRLWDYPIIYIYRDVSDPDPTFLKMAGEPMQGDILTMDLQSDVFTEKLVGEPTQRPTLIVQGSTDPQFAPPTPTNITNLSAAQEAKLETELPTTEGVDTIEVYRSKNPGGPYSHVASVSVASTIETWTDTTLTPFGEYYYVLKAATSVGDESLQSSSEEGVMTGSGNDINLRSIGVNSVSGGNEMVIEASSPNGGMEYSLDGGAYQTSNTFSNISQGTHTLDLRDGSGITASIEVEFSGIDGAIDTIPGSSLSLEYEWYDIQSYYDSNGHPTTKAEMDAYFDESNSGVSMGGSGEYSGAIKWSDGDQVSESKPSYLPADGYSWKVTGKIWIPVAGEYTFATDSDDSSDILIDGAQVLGWYGGHGMVNDFSHSGTVTLTRGWHTITVRMTEGGGGDGIHIGWQKPGSVLFQNTPPPAPSAKHASSGGGSFTLEVDTQSIDIDKLEIYRKAEADSSYSLLKTINYPSFPVQYTDNNYDKSQGHTYKAKIYDVSSQESPLSEVVKAALTEDFEDGLTNWTIHYSDFGIRTDRVYEGGQVAGAKSSSGLPQTIAAERPLPTALQQPSEASWYWNEDNNQYGSAFHFINSNDNLELALGTQNPQWQAWDGTGDNDEIWAANGYDRWIYYEVTFDWSNGTYDYYMEDLQTGDTRTGTRSLKHGVDVAKIGLGERPGSTNRHYTWWDKITIK